MANRTIYTNVFQMHYPHLEKPQKSRKPEEPGKYGIRMAFPKTGVMPPNIGTQSTDVSNIMAALNEVCMEEWNCDFANAPTVRGIQFPPKWVDGDQDWKKDENGNRLINQPNENSVGKFLLGAKNIDKIGVCDPTGGLDLDPKEVYAGCWCRAELEVAAYEAGDGKDKSSIVSIKVTNIQKCYDDVRIGGNGGVTKTATQAFAGMAVADTNVAPTGFNGQAAPAPALPVMPGQAAPMAPGVPAAAPVAPVVAQKTYSMTAKANGATKEQFLATPGWTEQMMIDQGYMVEDAPVAPAVPTTPGVPAAAPMAPGVPAAAPVAPVVALPGTAYLAPTVPGMPV